MAIELGIGLIGIGAGMTIYPSGLVQKGTRFYTGIKFNSVVLVDVGGGTVAYIPFGVTFFSNSPFIFGFPTLVLQEESLSQVRLADKLLKRTIFMDSVI